MLDGRCSRLDFFENEWFSIEGFSVARSESVKDRDTLPLLAFLRGVPFRPADDDRFTAFTFELPKRIYKWWEGWAIDGMNSHAVKKNIRKKESESQDACKHGEPKRNNYEDWGQVSEVLE